MDFETALTLLAAEVAKRNAQLVVAMDNPPHNNQKTSHSLSTAAGEWLGSDGAVEIGFPFSSVYVHDGTDDDAYMWLVLYSFQKSQAPILVRRGDVIAFDTPITKAFLWWPAQTNGAGVSRRLDVTWFVQGQMLPGRKSITTQSPKSGTILTSIVCANAMGTTAAIMVAADSERLICTIENQSGTTTYIGGAGVTAPGGALPGITLLDGDSFIYEGSAAVYGVLAAGAETALSYAVAVGRK